MGKTTTRTSVRSRGPRWRLGEPPGNTCLAPCAMRRRPSWEWAFGTPAQSEPSARPRGEASDIRLVRFKLPLAVRTREGLYIVESHDTLPAR